MKIDGKAALDILNISRQRLDKLRNEGRIRAKLMRPNGCDQRSRFMYDKADVLRLRNRPDRRFKTKKG